MLTPPTTVLRSSRTWTLLICICLTYFLFVNFRFENAAWRKTTRQHDAVHYQVSVAAQNETLGFEQIFYISMPHRSDRQDAMTMLAASTNIRLTRQTGVNGNSVDDKAKPKGAQSLRPAQLGCWRSHANVWQKIIAERVQTAIILEDDADWDVNVHDIFQELSIQMRKGSPGNHELSSYELAHAPYGLHWDVLYIGTCWNIGKDVRPPSHIYEDENAPNSTEMSSAFRRELEYWGANSATHDRVRVLAPSWYPVCTIGYAVTLKGARKLLYTVGDGEGVGAPLDLAMVNRIQSGKLQAFTVVPPLVTPWKSGKVDDSDINEPDGSKDDLGGSENLRRSGRMALAAALKNSAP